MRINDPSRIRHDAVLVLAAALLAGLTGLSCSKHEKANSSRNLKIPVVVAKAEQKDIPVRLKSIGSVESVSSIAVKSQVGGVVSQVHFQEGQEVKAGDMLFTIEPTYFRQMLNQAQATLKKNRAQLKNARVELKRYEELIKKDLVSRQQYDQARTELEVLKATVDADGAAVENARLYLSYCSIKSPLFGRTGSLNAHVGDTIKANDIALVTINQLEPIHVSFNLPEQYLPEIKQYMAAATLKVSVSPPSRPGLEEQGVLNFYDNAVDKATGNIRLKAVFDNADKNLWPGQFVNVSLYLTERKGAVTVPSQAVLAGQSGQYVYVVKPDGSAEARPVVTSLTHQGLTAVDKGLSAGESVVIDGQLQLVHGAKVEVKPAAGSEAGVGRQESK